MISIEDALKDLDKVEAESSDSCAKAVVKCFKVIAKLLSTMRSNQLLTEEDKKKISADKAKRQAIKEVK